MCSTSCGKGSKIRARTCSGDIGTCLGERTETKDCQVAKCQGCIEAVSRKRPKSVVNVSKNWQGSVEKGSKSH